MEAFEILCEKLGITLHFVSNGRFEMNRQVEKANRDIKRSISRYDVLNPNISWFDWHLEILVDLHIVVYCSNGYIPLFLTYKENLFLPDHLLKPD